MSKHDLCPVCGTPGRIVSADQGYCEVRDGVIKAQG